MFRKLIKQIFEKNNFENEYIYILRDRNVVANVNHVLKQIFLFNILKSIIE